VLSVFPRLSQIWISERAPTEKVYGIVPGRHSYD
jgi:hypothetical protein